ncbi:hypothetical protein ABGB09_29555 [Streptomyces sp. B8F3]|uniref:hypothetical protein n=1 Tax=Streptomyces sp. B8F3 TaxID=3153573 RepID=UPI00325F0452
MTATTGNDEFGQALAERLAQFIVDADAGSARSLQKCIGPSEVGEPCERRLSYRMLDWPQPNLGRDPIAAVIGTGFHMWMAEQFQARNTGDRYKTEQRVVVRTGYTEHATLSGSADLYDRLLGCNLDWKLVGSTSLDRYRRQGPGEKYRIQAHLYGLGQENAGEQVDRVAVVFVARWHQLKIHVWSEPYQQQIALDALARLDRIQQRLMDLDPEAHPQRWGQIPADPAASCRFCPWLKPGSTDLSAGCPGNASAPAGGALDALIA